ncbi:hypothetical protein M3Y97_00102200 [Aphelenchoides bicaudatus]|nr:hypothetical protein M3Y97_00102200 [Aphelenchoides bicaudatus]
MNLLICPRLALFLKLFWLTASSQRFFSGSAGLAPPYGSMDWPLHGGDPHILSDGFTGNSFGPSFGNQPISPMPFGNSFGPPFHRFGPRRFNRFGGFGGPPPPMPFQHHQCLFNHQCRFSNQCHFNNKFRVTQL